MGSMASWKAGAILALISLLTVGGLKNHGRHKNNSDSAISRHGSSQACQYRYLHAFSATDPLPICSRENMLKQDYLEGSWVKLPSGCYPTSHEALASYAYEFKQECGNEDDLCGPGTSACEEKVVRLAQYAWQPSRCQLIPFDADLLSERLRGQRVLFVGDSTMRQQFFALGLLMRACGMVSSDVTRESTWTTIHNATFSVAGVQFLAGEPFFEDGDDLGDQRSKRPQDKFDINKASGWLGEAAIADYVIFSTGYHHHRRDPTFGHYRAMVDSVLQALQQRFKGAKMWFQTSFWAHESCERIHTPREYIPQPGKWGWMEVLFNEWHWKDVAQARGMQNFAVLNVSMMRTRGDSHIEWKLRTDGGEGGDCLHLCSPGMTDYSNWLAAHALIQERE